MKDTNRDNSVEMTTTTENCLIISDTRPELRAIGKNTTTITIVIAVTVKPISDAPS